MAHTRTWNSSYEASPADADNLSEGAGKIRNVKVDVRERMALDHYMDTSGTDADHGQHKKVTFQAPLAADPDPGTDKGAVYTKDVSSKAELHFEDEDDNVVQLTTAGALNHDAMDGDLVDIDWDPTNYTPDSTTPSEADDDDDLTAHLQGIDTKLGSLDVILTGHLAGLGLGNNAVDSDHDIDVAVGSAADSTGAVYMVLASSMTKRIDASHADGTGNGGMCSGASLGNNSWYHVFLIAKTDGTVDICFDDNAICTNLPAAYSYFRRIGSVKTDGSANIVGFTQYGDLFLWDDPPLDVDGETTGTVDTTAANYTLTVPTGVQVLARFTAAARKTAALPEVYISSPSQNNEEPSPSAAPLWSVRPPSSGGLGGWPLEILTNTSAQVRARSNLASHWFSIVTNGWVDNRGK